MGKYNFRLTGIGIENFRIFNEYQYFNIRPLTILTGTNNAGKSTLGKAIMLLRKSWTTSKFGFLFSDSDRELLGNFDSNISYGSTSEIMKFKLFIDSDNMQYVLELHYFRNQLSFFKFSDKNQILCSCTYDLENKNVGFKNSFIFLDHNILDIVALQSKLGIENKELLNKVCCQILELLRYNSKFHFSAFHLTFSLNQTNPIKSLLESCRDNIIEGIYKDEYGFLLNSFLSEDLTFFFNKEDLMIDIFEFINKKYDPVKLLPKGLLEISLDNINDFYFESNLNTRVYKDVECPNLYKTLLYFYNNYVPKDTVQAMLYDWIVNKMKLVKPSSSLLSNFNNIEFIKIKTPTEYANLLTVSILSNNTWVDLSSLGFGASNLILKMLQLALTNKLMLLEEPEVNLHPSLQSKLADYLVATTDLKNLKKYFIRNIEFEVEGQLNINADYHSNVGSFRVIETHSEYLIRRLQYLVASVDSPLSAEDVQIYYFSNPLEENYEADNRIIDIKINKNGGLTEAFGTGFMDEADNIALELYLLQYK